jgi:hypothetical protein
MTYHYYRPHITIPGRRPADGPTGIQRNQSEPGRELGPVCEECGGHELEPWSGRVWHERNPEGWVGAERVEGPCPACGTTITEGGTTGLISIWD